MDIEIKIGREASGAHAIRVPSSFDKVSRNHAIIRWHDGVVTIEDTSSNGTCVNGQRIAKFQPVTIKENDIVWLGKEMDNQCYKLDLRQVFATFPVVQSASRVVYPQQNVGVSTPNPMSGNDQRTDYTKEFARLKKVYINYHKEMSELKKKSNMSMQLPRVLLSMIPALLGLVILLVSRDMTVRIVAMSAGSVLSGLIGTLTMGRSSSKQEDMAEKILDLQLKYEDEYKCPKCGKKYSLDLHWKKLQADGKCPYGCGAKFV